MKRSAPLLLFVALLLVAVCAQPALSIYKWVDDHGLLHITDYPPPSKTPEPAPAPEPPKPMQPLSAPIPTAAPVAPRSQPVSVPQTTVTKNVPASVTKPSATAVSSPTPVPAPSQSMPPVPRQHQMPMPQAGIMALAGGFMLIAILIGLAFYVYYALSMYFIAKKLDVAEAWMSWVPILNLWPFLSSAGKPCWWVLLLLVPLVNFIVIIYLWMCICENLGRNKWLGLLILVPVVNLILPGILAFSKKQ